MEYNAEYNSTTETLELLNGASVGDINTLTGVRLKVDGGTSDSYHTFDELYYHRMILFSVICNQNKELAWKSRLHDDGTMFEDYFIVGLKTPQGQFTYHYHKEYWDYFAVRELERAPKWDGHTSDDVIRLASLLEVVER